jgi:hypothetical protein
VRCTRWDALAALLAEPKDGHEGLVDTPLLFWAHPADDFTEPSGVDGPDLLNQNTGGLPEQVDLGTERRRPGAARGWRDQDHRAWQEFAGLDNHAVSSAFLLMADPAWQAERVHVTP